MVFCTEIPKNASRQKTFKIAYLSDFECATQGMMQISKLDSMYIIYNLFTKPMYAWLYQSKFETDLKVHYSNMKVCSEIAILLILQIIRNRNVMSETAYVLIHQQCDCRTIFSSIYSQ